MKIAVVSILLFAMVAVFVNSQNEHVFCIDDHDCEDVTCSVAGEVPFCHDFECHCHQPTTEPECTTDEQCEPECGPFATCDNGHCHGNCTHHK